MDFISKKQGYVPLKVSNLRPSAPKEPARTRLYLRLIAISVYLEKKVWSN